MVRSVRQTEMGTLYTNQILTILARISMPTTKHGTKIKIPAWFFTCDYFKSQQVTQRKQFLLPLFGVWSFY